MRRDPMDCFMISICLSAGFSLLVGMALITMKWMGWLEWEWMVILIPFMVAAAILLPMRWIGIAIMCLFDIY